MNVLSTVKLSWMERADADFRRISQILTVTEGYPDYIMRQPDGLSIGSIALPVALAAVSCRRYGVSSRFPGLTKDTLNEFLSKVRLSVSSAEFYLHLCSSPSKVAKFAYYVGASYTHTVQILPYIVSLGDMITELDRSRFSDTDRFTRMKKSWLLVVLNPLCGSRYLKDLSGDVSSLLLDRMMTGRYTVFVDAVPNSAVRSRASAVRFVNDSPIGSLPLGGLLSDDCTCIHSDRGLLI